MYQAVCDKCKKECEVPFRPTSGKPIYCDGCFGKTDKTEPKDDRQINEQFTLLHTKLDQILTALAACAPKTKIAPKKKAAPTKKAKPKKPTAKKKSAAKKKAKPKKK